MSVILALISGGVRCSYSSTGPTKKRRKKKKKKRKEKKERKKERERMGDVGEG